MSLTYQVATPRSTVDAFRSSTQDQCKTVVQPPMLVVPLGSYCGVRKSMQKVGCDNGLAMPFDWMRTRIEGVLHFMRNDFEGFFDYVTSSQIQGAGGMVMFRDYLKSFWHHDPDDPETREAFARRFARFNGIDATSDPVLFVRSVAHTSELAQTEDLADELTHRFGPRAMLLLLVDFQSRTQGPVLVADRPNLLLHFVPSAAHGDPDGAPYREPLISALRWAQGGSVAATATLETTGHALRIADISNGWDIHGFTPFEASPGLPAKPRQFGMASSQTPTTASRASTPPNAGSLPFHPTFVQEEYGTLHRSAPMPVQRMQFPAMAFQVANRGGPFIRRPPPAPRPKAAAMPVRRDGYGACGHPHGPAPTSHTAVVLTGAARGAPVGYVGRLTQGGLGGPPFAAPPASGAGHHTPIAGGAGQIPRAVGFGRNVPPVAFPVW